jgi:hypothetical protein
MRDVCLQPRCERNLRSAGALCSVGLYLVTDASGQPIGPIFKARYQSTLRNIPEKRISPKIFWLELIIASSVSSKFKTRILRLIFY